VAQGKERLNREFSAGGVVFKKTRDPKGNEVKTLWLVTKSAPSKLFPYSYWRLPKGWLDDDKRLKGPGPKTLGKIKASQDDLKRAALKEVEEEGGVKARIIAKIGTTSFFKTFKGKKTLKFVTFYLMEWLKDLPQGFAFETEEVSWLTYGQARKKLSFHQEKEILDKAEKILSQRNLN